MPKKLAPARPTRVSERLRNKSPLTVDLNGNNNNENQRLPSITQEPVCVPMRPHLLWTSQSSRRNYVQQGHNYSYFSRFDSHLSQLNWSKPVGSYLDSFRVSKICSPFDRRITAIEWQPRPDSTTVAAASKNGDIFLLHVDREENRSEVDDVQLIFKGGGPGHYIGALKWDSVDQQSLYAANMNGQVEEYDVQVKKLTIVGAIPYPDHFKHWWTAIEESKDNRLILAGNTHGIVVAFDKRSNTPAWQYNFHRLSKVQHLEFSRAESWLLASSGNDKGAKLWDIRQLGNNVVSTNYISKSEQIDCLDEVNGDRPFNVASFNFRGDLLVTSDQHHWIHVYQGPTWREILKIAHPHRQFQHLTPIRATWHPLADLILIGRYPDPKLDEANGTAPLNSRTIDVFCGQTGHLVTQLFYPQVDYITTITKMNPYGSLLACASGSHLVIWKPHNSAKQEKKPTGNDSDPHDSDDSEDSHADFKKNLKRKSVVSKKKPAKKTS